MRALTAIFAMLLLSSCAPGSGEPPPSVCDGISAEMGGCGSDRPTFAGQTCVEVGTEFGAHLAERAIPLFDGPQTVNGDDRTSRLAQLMIVHAQLANKHLRDTGQAVACDVPEFIAAATDAFPPEFIGASGRQRILRSVDLVR